MHRTYRRAAPALGVAWALLGPANSAAPRAQERPAPRQADEPARPLVVAGRVVDGLRRPVPGVAVRVHADPPGGETTRRDPGDTDGERRADEPARAPLATFATDADGRFAGSLASPDRCLRLELDKEGYESISGPIRSDEDLVMRVSVKHSSVYGLTLGNEDDNVRRLRGFLASAEWAGGDEELRREFFKYQADLRPLARRLLPDPIVGAAAKESLARLADPADKELVAAPPPETPLPEVCEADLIDAVRATARRVNWFSSDPEPRITMRRITLSRDLDRALVEVGINLAPFTGVMWEFVFHRDGKRWILRRMTQTGRG